MDMLTRIRPALRWIGVVVAAMAIVGVSYRVLIPTKGEAEPDEVFPSDHGLADLAALQLDEVSKQFYECWIEWAARNTDVLRISDDFILRPESKTWWNMRIESTGRRPTAASLIDGSWWIRHGRGLDSIRAPCRVPGFDRDYLGSGPQQQSSG